ncbi:MAG: zinc-ribbon domain-containing protein, partial [Caldimonas sp.]
MSLATRCTSCGTVFRVAQDQLKVSEGWVRCGRCDAVFNALEGLLDLDRETPAEWDEGAPPSPGPERDPPAVADQAAADDDAAGLQERADAYATTAPASLGDLLADPIDAHLFRNRRAESDKSPPVQVDE